MTWTQHFHARRTKYLSHWSLLDGVKANLWPHNLKVELFKFALVFIVSIFCASFFKNVTFCPCYKNILFLNSAYTFLKSNSTNTLFVFFSGPHKFFWNICLRTWNFCSWLELGQNIYVSWLKLSRSANSSFI